MGTIIARKRSDGSTGYRAQIVRKEKGKIVRQETQTFDREAAAIAWLNKRETELSAPGAIARANAPARSLASVIDRYIAESTKQLGRTNLQVLKAIKNYDIANMDCGKIESHHLVEFAKELSTKGRKPQTVGSYISYLSAIFRIAKPAWNIPLNHQAIRDANVVLSRMGTTSKSESRDRRPTLDELDRLMTFFTQRSDSYLRSSPMHRIIAFALFSTRRQEEITRQTWADFDPINKRVMVRDMKHPGAKKGNDIWCELPDEAVSIVLATPRTAGEIFPYETQAISKAFTRACAVLGIDDLRFHDLRHEGVSRLFEMGKTIPQVASVSGHKSWQNLQRYAHIRQVGDKYEGWKWLEVVAQAAS
jgi:integrase